jgi:hypothetical protein
MALETEIARYNELLPELLASSEGKFAVIKGRELIGVFDDIDEGYRAALDKYGVTSFLLRPIRPVQPTLDLRNLHLGLIRGGV